MKRWMPSGLLGLALVLGALMAVGLRPAAAQEATPPPSTGPSDDEVNLIAKNLYCPVCENVPLDVCPTVACQRWRDQIREKLTEGWSEQEIYDYFALHYGDQVLAIPPRAGLNWLVYIVPPLVIVIGGLTLFGVFRRMRATDIHAEAASQKSAGQGSAVGEYESRLEEELNQLDRSE